MFLEEQEHRKRKREVEQETRKKSSFREREVFPPLLLLSRLALCSSSFSFLPLASSPAERPWLFRSSLSLFLSTSFFLSSAWRRSYDTPEGSPKNAACASVQVRRIERGRSLQTPRAFPPLSLLVSTRREQERRSARPKESSFRFFPSLRRISPPLSQ